MLNDNRAGYGWITIALHWVVAPLVFFMFGLGVYMRTLDYYSPWYHKAPDLHIALGILVFILMLTRLAWRTYNRSPDPLPSLNKLTILAATSVKIALYLLVFLICITGYQITTNDGEAANFFGLFSIPAMMHLGPDNADRIGLIHKYLAWSLVIIALLHALAALFHHFVKRDKTLVRMLRASDTVE